MYYKLQNKTLQNCILEIYQEVYWQLLYESAIAKFSNHTLSSMFKHILELDACNPFFEGKLRLFSDFRRDLKYCLFS